MVTCKRCTSSFKPAHGKRTSELGEWCEPCRKEVRTRLRQRNGVTPTTAECLAEFEHPTGRSAKELARRAAELLRKASMTVDGDALLVLVRLKAECEELANGL